MTDFDDFISQFEDSQITPIGSGGQKEVYFGIHSQYGPIVIKRLLHPNERAKREIDIVVKHHFAHVPQIYDIIDVDWLAGPSTVILEEFVDGDSLRKVIDRKDHYGFGEIADFLEQGLLFVDQIFSNGIIHRDIKPENIILSKGEYYFIDFGIARDLDASSLTETGAIGPNTPGYAAPELFLGEKKAIDDRSDLFSLGVVAYELLTGVNPFRKPGESIYHIYSNTLTVTPIEYQVEGDEHQQLMGLITALMSRDRYKRPRNARTALGWLTRARQDFEQGR